MLVILCLSKEISSLKPVIFHIPPDLIFPFFTSPLKETELTFLYLKKNLWD